MSSHHFVKENQEPALVIANGQPCHERLLGELLEWSPYVVVLDGAVERVTSLGIKFDVLLGDFDRLDKDNELLKNQPDIEIIYTPDQTKTDLEKALDFLVKKGHKAVNIVWATGWRMDHTFNNICTLGKYADKINAVILDDFSKIFVLPKEFKKYYTKGQVLSLFALGNINGITTKGLVYNLNDECLSIIERSGSSNESAETGIVEINYAEGLLILMECQD
ncbi:MAG: thiamine diphosphokinase [Bacteroidia bacterium]